MIQNYINHIVFVIDSSGSMSHLSNEVVKVFDGQVAHLAKRSKELDQETRVSVYLFDTEIKCLIYDMDVMRLPSLRSHYHPGGGTALLDADVKAISDLEQTAQLYGDHAFLIYTLTDGEENSSDARSQQKLSKMLKEMPDNWTMAVLVPNQNGVHEAKRYGFPAANIQVWNAIDGGVEEVGERIRKATDNFMAGRAKGIRGTRNLFALDVDNLSKKTVTRNLDELSRNEYKLMNVKRTASIRDYIEDEMGVYIVGSCYYELAKTEKIQAQKQIVVRDKNNGRVYSGQNARDILGLPDYEVRVAPADHDSYEIYVQSTSVNRKLLKGQNIIVLK